MRIPIFFALLFGISASAACGSSHTPDDGGGRADGGRADGGRTDGGRTDGGRADCETLTEAECIGSPECGPLYDDYCCPLCVPIGACADCSRPQMFRCGPIIEACVSDPPVCGGVGGWTCSGGTADCSMASPVTGGRCDVPGCVQAIEPGCADDCPVTCVPVTGVSCTASCEIVPPPCPMGFVNEGDGSCYTGLCIAESACLPAQPVGP